MICGLRFCSFNYEKLWQYFRSTDAIVVVQSTWKIIIRSVFYLSTEHEYWKHLHRCKKLSKLIQQKGWVHCLLSHSTFIIFRLLVVFARNKKEICLVVDFSFVVNFVWLISILQLDLMLEKQTIQFQILNLICIYYCWFV